MEIGSKKNCIMICSGQVINHSHITSTFDFIGEYKVEDAGNSCWFKNHFLQVVIME